MKEFWNKVKNLNSWSWIALVGYIQMTLYYLLWLDAKASPSGSLVDVFYMFIIWIVSLIICFIIFLISLNKEKNAKPIKNTIRIIAQTLWKIFVIIGCIPYWLPILIIVFCIINEALSSILAI